MLISGASDGEIIAWNFKTAEKMHFLQAQQRIMCFQVQWPIVITCTLNVYSMSDDNVKGVKIFNMENQNLVRQIPVGRASDLYIHGDILMICELSSFRDRILWQGETETKSVTLWDMPQLLNNSLKIEEVTKRKFEAESELETTQFCSIVGSNVFTSEDNTLIQRSFWP